MIDPQVQSVLEEIKGTAAPMPEDQEAWLRGYRAELEAIVAMQGAKPDIAIVEREVPIGDRQTIGLRLYRPPARGFWPTLLFVHGGGFVGGSLNGYDIPLRWLALRSGWQIAAVDYRLAPEHPYPAAHDDCMKALSFLLDSEDVRADPARIAVGGDSAGGLLATVLSQRAHDAGIFLVLQLLLYPNTDLRSETPHESRRTYDGTIIRIDELYRSVDLYLGAHDRARADVSPLLAENVEHLCPALLVTNEYDPLRDEAEAYGLRLSKAGVIAETIRIPGSIHSIIQRGARIAIGDILISRIAETLKAIA